MTDTAARIDRDVSTEIKDWLSESWDPDMTVGEWWERLGLAGWSAPTWPAEWFGQGLSREEAVRVQNAIAAHGALAAPGGLGLLLAGPTIITHGTDEQKDLYLRDIVTGRKGWCQLFSEPGAGSDLAGLQTKALKDGDEWIVNGQKVWTSGGQSADLGMLIARTDADVPKHQGITYFALDMHQPGIDVRPLREMTGRAMFNEVFITDARTGDGTVIGGTNNGWAVANTTLMHERQGLGAGGGTAGAGTATPGSVAGDLERRAGDFVGGGGRRGGGAGNMFGAAGQLLIQIARSGGSIDDATVRQELARLHTLNEIARFTNLRQKALKVSGQPEIPGAGNLAKLAMSQILRLTRDLGLRLLGPHGTLHGYTSAEREHNASITNNAFAPIVTEMALFSPGPSIYGGTDEIQRNIIGERVLGLSKEPSNDRVVSFRELPKNG